MIKHIYYRSTINEAIKAKYPKEISSVQNTAQKIQFLGGFKPKYHTLHSMKAVDNVAYYCSAHVDILCCRLKMNETREHWREILVYIPSSLSLNDKWNQFFRQSNNLVLLPSFNCRSSTSLREI